MRNPIACKIKLPLLCVLPLLTSVEAAVATTTVCSNSAAKRYHYGENATLKFRTRLADPESITDAVKRFAQGNNLSYSSVGGFDPYKDPTKAKSPRSSLSLSNSTKVQCKAGRFSPTCEIELHPGKPIAEDYRQFTR